MTTLPSINGSTRAIETRVLAWSAFIVALFFISMGLGYWLHSRQSITTCVFGHPDCSAAAATWTLLVATVCAFIAAYEAATKAGQALSVSQDALRVSQQALTVETEPILGQWICTDEERHKVPRVVVFIEDHQYSIGKPKKYNKELFVPVQFDFENLGRNALLDVRVTLRLQWEGEPPVEVPIALGSIGAHRDAHVSIYLLWDFATRPQIGWPPEATILVAVGETFKLRSLLFSSFPIVEVEGPMEPLSRDGAKSKRTSEEGHNAVHGTEKAEQYSHPQPPPKDARWLINTIDPDAIKRAADEARLAGGGGKKSGSIREDPEA